MSKSFVVLGVVCSIIVGSCGSPESGGDLSFRRVSGVADEPMSSESGPDSGDSMVSEVPLEDSNLGWSESAPSEPSGSVQIWSIRPDGTELRQLTETEGVDSFDPVVSPDGRQISYLAVDSRSETLASARLWVMDADGSNRKVLLDEAVVISISPVVWSNDSSSIRVIVREEGERKIVSVDVETNSVETLAFPAEGYWYPVWSPSGKRVVYAAVVSSPGGFWDSWEIWVADGDGRNKRKLTDVQFDATSDLYWLADDKTIIFSGYVGVPSPRGLFSLWKMDVDTGEISILGQTEALSGSMWLSRDGESLAMGSYGPSCGLTVMSTESGEGSCVLPTYYGGNPLTWSPDSTHLAFIADGYSLDPSMMSPEEMEMSPEEMDTVMSGRLVWIVSSDGSESKMIASLPQAWNGGGYTRLEWGRGPDSGLLVFAVQGEVLEVR